MKIDLHLHSKFSKRPSQWVLQKLGCPESFTDPVQLYHITKKAGMAAMTLTDHNTINGCLEIAHLPNTFISEEVTTYFPEDGCKVHVLVYNIDENIHADIQKVRENILDLVTYLNQKNVIHALAHPLFSVNDRLTLDHFEKLLLLFKLFELNGARDENQNILIKEIVLGLSRRTLDFLANKHGLTPAQPLFIKKGVIGGSDDHSSLNVARMFTEVEDARDVTEFLGAIGTERCRPIGCGATPRTLAHNLYGIAYQYFQNRLNWPKYIHQDVLVKFCDRLLHPYYSNGSRNYFSLNGLWGRRRRNGKASSDNVQEVIRQESEKAIMGDPKLADIIKNGATGAADNDEVWFRFVNQVCNKVMGHMGENLYEHLLGANVFNIFGSIGAFGSVYTLMAPYFVALSLFSRDRVLEAQARREFTSLKGGFYRDGQRIKIAHFTDTFHEINGGDHDPAAAGGGGRQIRQGHDHLYLRERRTGKGQREYTALRSDQGLRTPGIPGTETLSAPFPGNVERGL